MDEFLHRYEMESLQLGITARREIIDQVRRHVRASGAVHTGLSRTDQALAAREAKAREAKESAGEDEQEHWSMVVAGNSKELFRNRMRNIHFVALALALEKHRLPGLIGFDLRLNHLGEEHEYDEDDVTEHNERRYALDTATHLGMLLQVYNLDSVDLSGNRIGSESLRLLSETLLQGPTTLRVLNLNGNPIGVPGLHALAEYLGSPHCALEEVNLGNSEMEIENLITISSALRDNHTLRVLNLDNPIIKTKEEEVVQHIGKMLQVNDTLRSISLCKHHLTDHGAQVLAERLLENRVLECLVLRANNIGATGASALAALILKHDALAHFDLSANRIGDVGAAAFAQVLHHNSSNLTTLSLSSTYITDDGLATIARACARPHHPDNQRLRSLLLWGNDFGPKACELFLELCEGRFKDLGIETDFMPFRIDDQFQVAHAETPLAKGFSSPKR
ncbi:TPA: hypothetical protein N0F65_000684 [Lagenidium giganteum]|uniref:Uncharacterized protein n=1 Tax=Lagenidium giganteum TaxID=4803 RepID=A0AAV2YWI2_9STRA|nr:TPA: hypothetical protein N0F65_000684 [Lagenidium giganteum]